MKIIRINAVWCSGCLSMKKIWKEIESEYPDLDIVSYDYDFDKREVQKYNPGKVLPVIIFMKDGKETRLIGEQKKETILKMIGEYNEN
ncbi:MAG: thioredoxin family protein [Bacilli bacterium]|nr:thioredoxin family protein [Bacilli bacterium]